MFQKLKNSMTGACIVAMLLLATRLRAAQLPQAADLVDQLIELKEDPSAFFDFAQEHLDGFDPVQLAKRIELTHDHLGRLCAYAFASGKEGAERVIDYFGRIYNTPVDLVYLKAAFGSLDFVQKCIETAPTQRILTDAHFAQSLLAGAAANTNPQVFEYVIDLPQVATLVSSTAQKSGESLLNIACQYGTPSSVGMVLDRFAQLKDCTDKLGSNFFYSALGNVNQSVLDYLCSRTDCAPYGYKKLSNGDTLLHTACKISSLSMIQIVVKFFPDLIHTLGYDGASVCESALENPDPRVFRFFTQLACKPEFNWLIKHKNKDGSNLAHIACKKASLQTICFVLQAYPDLASKVDNTGSTLLHYLIYQNDPATLNYFFSNPAYKSMIMQKNNLGITIAHDATLLGSLAALDTMLKFHPELANAVDTANSSIVESAIFRQDTQAIVYFLADEKFLPLFDKKGSYNETILHRACTYSIPQTVKLLARKFPHFIGVRDDRGWGIWEYAQQNDQTAVLDFLQEMGYAPQGSQLIKAQKAMFSYFCKTRTYKLLKLFLKRCGTRYLGQTLSKRLIGVCLADPKLLDLLLDCDANLIRLGDGTGKTLLHHALLAKKVELAHLLLEYNADLFATDHDGVSCATVAVKEGLPEMISLGARLKLTRKLNQILYNGVPCLK